MAELLQRLRAALAKQRDARLTKSFGAAGLDITGYLDVRNLLNFKNVLQVFAVNGDIRNDEERVAHLRADLNDLATGASRSRPRPGRRARLGIEISF